MATNIITANLTPHHTITTPPTRPGYAHRKYHKSAPKDWWTEDIADLNIDLFRCVINTLRSTNMLSPQLIGEALHVYACRWLQDVTKSRTDRETSIASQMTQEESVKSIKQLEMILEATINDLTLSLHESSGDNPIYDIELVKAVFIASTLLEEGGACSSWSNIRITIEGSHSCWMDLWFDYRGYLNRVQDTLSRLAMSDGDNVEAVEVEVFEDNEILVLEFG
ncbi:BTB/POZ domain-containing protein isoform X1 [Tanacetum coccineum]